MTRVFAEASHTAFVLHFETGWGMHPLPMRGLALAHDEHDQT